MPSAGRPSSRGSCDVLCKWIGCAVPPRFREAFSTAQRRWSPLGAEPGLVGQVGGWDTTTGRAYILALWRDGSAYRSFMRHRHDALAAATGQERSYTEIEVTTGDVVFPMAGDAPSLAAAIRNAVVLRAADCRILLSPRPHSNGRARGIRSFSSLSPQTLLASARMASRFSSPTGPNRRQELDIATTTGAEMQRCGRSRFRSRHARARTRISLLPSGLRRRSEYLAKRPATSRDHVNRTV